jgi:hypothetical protein
LIVIPMSRTIATMRTNGAAQFSNRRTASMPRRMIRILRAQKTAKLSHRVQGCGPPKPIWIVDAFVHHESDPKRAPMTVKIAVPPIHVWMPNQPQATPARMRAGRFAPKTPNEARAKTGYGIPYFVPAWLFASIGTRTMMFASMIVRIAWYQAIPRRTRPAARPQVGMLWAIPIHRAT